MKSLNSYERNGDLVSTPPSLGGGESQPGGKEQLERAIDLLYKGKWIILLSVVLVFGATIVYLSQLTPEYEAHSLVLLTAQTGRTETSEDRSNPYGNASAPAEWGRSLPTELTLLQNSMALPRAVAQRLVSSEEDRSWTGEGSVLPSEGKDSLSVVRIAHRLQSRIRFVPTNNNVIRFTAVSTVPEETALIANLFAQEYVDLTQKASRASLSASRSFLEKQLEKRHEELNTAEAKLETYLSQHGGVSVGEKSSQIASQAAQMEVRRDQAEIQLRKHRASLQSLERQLEQISPKVARQIASGVGQDIQLIQEQIAELKATRQEALTYGNGGNQAQLQKVEAKIERLEEQAESLSQRYVDEIVVAGGVASPSGAMGLANVAEIKQQIAKDRLAITGLATEIASLDRLLQRYRSELQNHPGQEIELARLRRERERAERMYEYVIQQLQEVRIEEQGQLGYASIIAEASVPEAPVRPQSFRYLILGAFFGLLLGSGIAVFRYKLDNRIYTPDQLQKRGYTVTIIPDMQSHLRSAHNGKAFIIEDGEGQEGHATSLVPLHHPGSPITEAYRELRANLLFTLPEKRGTILVTSASVEEGKSTTAANLAAVFARAGHRTLLLDADLRRPQVHRLLGLKLEPGLMQVLHQHDPHFVLENMQTGVDNLYALTAGGISTEIAAELVGSLEMEELLNMLQERVEIIIVDSPPSLVVTEAKLLAPKCNVTLVVARAARTKEQELDRAVAELERVGGNVAEIALNGFNLSMAYNYRYRYRHYSQYGPHSEYYSS